MHVELLGSSERYYVGGLPQWADGGIVDVEVTGIGVKSQKSYKHHNQIAVGSSPCLFRRGCYTDQAPKSLTNP